MTQRQCMEDIDDEDLVQITGDAKLKRRIYDRKKQRRYREQLLRETTHLRNLIVDLEKQVSQLSLAKSESSDGTAVVAATDPLLSWKEVALALRDDVHHQHEMNHALQKHIAHYRELTRKMQMWVDASTAIPPPPPSLPNWRHVTLLADPAARQCGTDWITRQLYHNVDALFERVGFPNDEHGEVDDMPFDFSDPECYQCVRRLQREFPISASTLSDYLMQNLWIYCMVGAVVPSTVRQTIVGDCTYQHVIKTPFELANLISRKFVDPDRIVLVGTQILEDEAEPHDFRQRHRIFVATLDRLTPKSARIRILYMTSQSFTKAGFTPLDQEAPMWECDLSGCDSDALKLVHFQRYLQSKYDQLSHEGYLRLVQAMQASNALVDSENDVFL
ncbi:unnamed protein product [Aphanomyces euteiches]|nr:hypothetical protein AeRB84_003312 [Aphanomyces euteiches]